ncbi:MAG: hypothetical protein ABTQ34_06085 [Bdellovibrionales bacterium]
MKKVHTTLCMNAMFQNQIRFAASVMPAKAGIHLTMWQHEQNVQVKRLYQGQVMDARLRGHDAGGLSFLQNQKHLSVG